LAVAAVAAQAALAGLIWRLGRAGPLPMHYDIHGQVNRWGDRSEVAWVVLLTALGTVALYVLLPVLARPRTSGDAPGRSLPIARALLLVVALLISLMMTATGFGLLGAGRSPLPLVAGFVSLIMLAMGFLLGKVEPNPFVGVRTYWSLRSRLAWDKSNRLFGRIAFWAGLAGLVSFPLTPQPLGLMLVTAALGVGALAAVFESWRVWRNDPDAQAA
jgi:uncharacterized membrane protein